MVGIIILNYNAADDTIKCVAAIEKQTALAYHIYIVDGASNDDSYHRLAEYFIANSKVKLMQLMVNGGYSYGNNVGMKQAIADGATTLCIINPDVVLLNNAIDRMHTALVENKEVAVVGPRIFGPDRADMQFAAKPLTFGSFCMNRKPFINGWREKATELRFYPVDVTTNLKLAGSVSGCCFMISAADFTDMGLFDEKLFLYHEEDVLAYKMLLRNQLSMICMDAQVLHNHNSTTKKEGNVFVRFHKSISAHYVLKKYSKMSRLESIVTAILIIVPFASMAVVKKSYRSYVVPLIKHIAFDRCTDAKNHGKGVR